MTIVLSLTFKFHINTHINNHFDKHINKHIFANFCFKTRYWLIMLSSTIPGFHTFNNYPKVNNQSI